MPAPRQILIDLHDMGLDPTKPHRAIKASGRLARHTAADVAEEAIAEEAMPIVLEAAVSKPKTKAEKALDKRSRLVEALQQVTLDQAPVAVIDEPIKEEHTFEVAPTHEDMFSVNEEHVQTQDSEPSLVSDEATTNVDNS
jgi:hypothetical protein